MASFKDINGREWTVTLDAPTIKAIRTECDGLDLADLEGKAITQLVDDPCLLVDVLWMICRNQAEATGVSSAQFGTGLVGDPIEFATIALVTAIADFFPEKKRAVIRAAVGKDRAIRELALTRAMAKLNDPDLERALASHVEATLDAEFSRLLTRLSSATNTQDSLASVPAASP